MPEKLPEYSQNLSEDMSAQMPENMQQCKFIDVSKYVSMFVWIQASIEVRLFI